MTATETASGGYVTDVFYPHHVHRETMPPWLRATATALGFAAPDISRDYAWCELGCGTGLNALIAAAANPRGRFVGIDFNAAQIGYAQQLALEANVANARFVAADIAQLAAAPPIEPIFDFIVLHGLWAWVAPQVRQAVLEFARGHLKPGGLLYVAYMSHPGATALIPVQRLLFDHAAHVPGDSAAKASAALAFVRRLAQAGAGVFAAQPGLSRQLDAMANEAPEYLAHEFLTAHWQPQHSGEVIAAFEAIGLRFLGSATPLENIDAVSVPGGCQPLLAGLPPALAETVRDLARHQSLRRDLYQRDAQALDGARHLAALDALRVIALPGAPTGGGLVFETRIGDVPGPAELFGPILEALARGPHTFAQLRRLPAFAQAPGLLNQALQMLVWGGHAQWLRPDDAAAPAADALNAVLQERGIGWRAEPAFGAALERV